MWFPNESIVNKQNLFSEQLPMALNSLRGPQNYLSSHFSANASKTLHLKNHFFQQVPCLSPQIQAYIPPPQSLPPAPINNTIRTQISSEMTMFKALCQYFLLSKVSNGINAPSTLPNLIDTPSSNAPESIPPFHSEDNNSVKIDSAVKTPINDNVLLPVALNSSITSKISQLLTDAVSNANQREHQTQLEKSCGNRRISQDSEKLREQFLIERLLSATATNSKEKEPFNAVDYQPQLIPPSSLVPQNKLTLGPDVETILPLNYQGQVNFGQQTKFQKIILEFNISIVFDRIKDYYRQLHPLSMLMAALE